MLQITEVLSKLPEDHYGVCVENEVDARRLLYLVEQVGDQKLVTAVRKYHERWPDEKPFVSTLLKRFGIKVPAKTFAPVNEPIYRVYLLVHQESGKIKVGHSGDWLRRVYRFSHECDVGEFDSIRSVGVLFENKRTSSVAENAVKKAFRSERTEPPASVPYGAYGHTEWFNGVIYDDALRALREFQSESERSYMTLCEAEASDLRGAEGIGGYAERGILPTYNIAERRQRQEAVRQAKASVELEGFKLSPTTIAHLQRFADGEIEFEELMRLADEEARSR